MIVKKDTKTEKTETGRHLGHENFFQDIFDNNVQTRLHIDEKANWILVISGGLMTLLFSQIRTAVTTNNTGMIIIFSSAFISFLLSLLIFEPPKFFLRGNRHHPKDLTFYKAIWKKYSPEEYAELLKNIKTNEQVIEQYAYSISDMVLKSIVIKSRMIKWPTYTLFFGVLTETLFLLLG
ncbi:MAG: hypothetical protein KJ583_03160 [Nanoarchaeota archaeon]|nr:hypothetical protein [Nanoarchaeota archaeon]MBU1604293.1 hypothetical protein [Nanoarchaeota archaeon]MBU2442928.1 hypothetical protein [Nanoarchaeota archaeon]